MGVLSSALRAEVESQDILTATFKMNGQSFKVGSKPLTPADFDYVNSVLSKSAVSRKMNYTSFQQDSTDFGGQISLLIRKVRSVDDDGNLSEDRVFDVSDKPMLSRMGVDVISEWFVDLFESQITVNPDDEVDDAEGK